MKQMSSADFRKSYASEAVPVEVTSYGKTIGKWYPTGFDVPAEATPVDAEPIPEAAPQRMTIRPVKGTPKTMQGVEKRIIDPIEKGHSDRSTWGQLSARMNSQNDSRRR